MAKLFNRWVILGAMAVILILGLVSGLLLWIFTPARAPVAAPTAAVTMIAAPTSTPLPLPTIETTATPSGQVVEGIGIGYFVQISGTGGDGLRLRSGAGTTYPQRFIGMDAEVFEVKEGPKEADGFTWWYLVAPYDTNRSGWAASKFLTVVPKQ